jgi:hypothetical protein
VDPDTKEKLAQTFLAFVLILAVGILLAVAFSGCGRDFGTRRAYEIGNSGSGSWGKVMARYAACPPTRAEEKELWRAYSDGLKAHLRAEREKQRLEDLAHPLAPEEQYRRDYLESHGPD